MCRLILEDWDQVAIFLLNNHKALLLLNHSLVNFVLSVYPEMRFFFSLWALFWK